MVKIENKGWVFTKTGLKNYLIVKVTSSFLKLLLSSFILNIFCC